MGLLKDFLRQYWLNMVAFTIFVVALIRYVQLAKWEQQLVPFAVAAFGFVCVIARDAVSDCTGRWGCYTTHHFLSVVGSTARNAVTSRMASF